MRKACRVLTLALFAVLSTNSTAVERKGSGKDLCATLLEGNVKAVAERYDVKAQIETTFGAPLRDSDLQIFQAALRLYKDLPPTAGVSAVIDTLRGMKPTYKNRPEYAIAAQDNRYSEAKLRSLLSSLESNLQNEGFIEKTQINDDREWIQRRTVDAAILDALHALAGSLMSSSAATAKPASAKPFTAKEFNQAAARILDIKKIFADLQALEKDFSTYSDRVQRYYGASQTGLDRVKSSQGSTSESKRALFHLNKFSLALAPVARLGKGYVQNVNVKPMAEVEINARGEQVGSIQFYWQIADKLIPTEDLKSPRFLVEAIDQAATSDENMFLRSCINNLRAQLNVQQVKSLKADWGVQTNINDFGTVEYENKPAEIMIESWRRSEDGSQALVQFVVGDGYLHNNTTIDSLTWVSSSKKLFLEQAFDRHGLPMGGAKFSYHIHEITYRKTELNGDGAIIDESNRIERIP